MRRYLSTIAFILTCLALLSVSCAKKPSEKIRIGYIPFNADLPFFIAVDKGFFKEENLEIEPIRFGDSSQALNAMLAKQVDIVAGLTFSIYFAAEQESPAKFKLFIPFAEVESKIMSYLLVQIDSNISALPDLKGKRIGTYTGATQLLYLKLFLNKIGFNPDKDVTIIQVATDLQIQALAAKQFDALFTVEPYGTIALERGIGKVLLKNPRYHYITSPFWSGASAVYSEFFNTHKEKIHKIYRALAKSLDFIETNEIDAKLILTKFTPMDESIALKSGLYKWYKMDDDIDFPSIQQIADFMFEYKLLNNKVDAKSLFISDLR